jgi:DNA polymerase II small subunit
LKGAEAAMDLGEEQKIDAKENQSENQNEESEKILMEPSLVNEEDLKQPLEPEPSLFQSQEQSSPLETEQQRSDLLVKAQGVGGARKLLAKEYESDIKIIKDVTGHSTTEGTLKDFTKYFQERFRKLRKLLQIQRREVMGSIDIAKARIHQGPIKIIGIINSVRTTKQGHKIIELEDETDTISALINNTSPLISMTFVNDEVICLIGKLGKTDLIYVEDVIRPDIPIARKQNRSEDPLCCLFMADIHIGSTTFLHDSWDKFINWLNGKYSISGTDTLRDKLKYIVVSGDAVDGIGIYPNQELELEITDIYAQYETLAKKFEDIPQHIHLILQPGNHDAVRLAEPQPAFPEEIVSLFSNEIEFVGNPCYFTLNDVEVLSYHGCSMDDFVMQIPDITYNAPIKIMKEMLVRRHLAPVYGDKTPIAPEHQDYMVIDRIPDIFVTGHIHKTAVDNYRDIVLINASAWQAQTDYQKMRNFNPEPGNVILSDLQTGALKILNFD